MGFYNFLKLIWLNKEISQVSDCVIAWNDTRFNNFEMIVETTVIYIYIYIYIGT